MPRCSGVQWPGRRVGCASAAGAAAAAAWRLDSKRARSRSCSTLMRSLLAALQLGRQAAAVFDSAGSIPACSPAGRRSGSPARLVCILHPTKPSADTRAHAPASELLLSQADVPQYLAIGLSRWQALRARIHCSRAGRQAGSGRWAGGGSRQRRQVSPTTLMLPVSRRGRHHKHCTRHKC